MICKFFRLLLLKCWCLQGLGLGVCAKQCSSGSGIERQMLIRLHSALYTYTESFLQLSCKETTRRIHESLYEFCTVRRSKSSSISNLNVWFYYYAHSCSKYCNFKDFYFKNIWYVRLVWIWPYNILCSHTNFVKMVVSGQYNSIISRARAIIFPLIVRDFQCWTRSNYPTDNK